MSVNPNPNLVGLPDAKGYTIISPNEAPQGKILNADDGSWLLTYKPGYAQTDLNRFSDFALPTEDEIAGIVERIDMGQPKVVTVSFNRMPLSLHQDLWNNGDCQGWSSVLSVHRRGEYEGFLTVFPEIKAAFDLQDGDVLIYDSLLWHGNTLVSGQNFERSTVVMAYDRQPA